MDEGQVFARWRSGPEGLEPAWLEQRRARYGENRLLEQRPRPAWLRLLTQFNNVLLYVLMVSATVTLWLGYVSDALVIAAVVVINALVGFLQEGRAEAALRAIQRMLVSECTVVRGGVARRVAARELVPGDVVLLAPGDRVPADLRLFRASELYCDEAMLTGESLPAAKGTKVLEPETELAERACMAWMGALVTAGSGQGIVVATGVHTELGHIGQLVETVKAPRTPLTLALGRFARQLSLLILVVTVFVLIWGTVHGGLALTEMFRVAVGIMVAAIPEGLPAVVTVTLAIGVQRMAALRAVVRKLPAVEVLGSVTVICSDKTGTLTRNEMTTRRLMTASGEVRFGGEGYAPEGTVQVDNEDCAAVLARAAQVCLLCNDAGVEQSEQGWVLQGDPTEGALYVMARKTGLTPGDVQRWRRRAVIPFAAERLFMATLNDLDGQPVMLVKGAPERLLSLATEQRRGARCEPLVPDFWHQALEQLADDGMRMLGLAYKVMPAGCDAIDERDLREGLVFLGLTATTDPPRAEAIEAVETCHRAGIRVAMITGDNPRTAAAIARQLGLPADKVLTGRDLAGFDDEALQAVVADVSVFARTSPADKLRLVEALQRRGDVVAMTGDGVNDSPALRRADIGVAMGRKGTDAARDASAMVLTDDNFATIAAAVREGRTVYDNISKTLLFILPTSMAEAAVLLVAVLFGLSLPITPPQILWVNMITAVTLGLALAFEGGDPDLMCRAPRPPGKGLVTPLLLWRLVLVGGVGTGLVLWQFHRHADDLTLARNMAVLTLVFMEAAYLFACRRISAPAWSEPAVKSLAPAVLAVATVVLLQWLYMRLPFMRALFDSQPLPPGFWGEAALTGVVVLLLVELEKTVVRAWRRGG